MADDPPSGRALQKALRFLSLRGRSTSELRAKLREKGFPDSDIARVTARLADLGYLDDAAFARDRARNLAVNRFYGNRRIEQDLMEKGVPEGFIRQAITGARLEMPEREALDILVGKKLRGRKIRELDRREKQRLAQSMIGKGFPAGMIFEVLGNKEEGLVDERE